MSNQMKIYFNDNFLKLKIPTKILVGDLINFVKKKLYIDEDQKLVLLSNVRRYSDDEEIWQKEINFLNREEFVLMEMDNFRKLPSKDKMSTLKIKDTNSGKKNSVKSSKNDFKISPLEFIKSCTDAKTLIVVPDVVKSKRMNSRDRLLNYLAERLERGEGIENYHEEDGYSDEDDDDDDDIYDEFYGLDESDYSDYSSYQSIHSIPIQNPLEARRALPIPGERSAERLIRMNNANNINIIEHRYIVERGANIVYEPNVPFSALSHFQDNRISNINSNALIPNIGHIRVIDPNNPNYRFLNYDEVMLEILLEMGFSLENSRTALRLTNNNIEEATSFLLNAPEIIYAENLDLAGPNVNMNINLPYIVQNNQLNSQQNNQGLLSNVQSSPRMILANSVPEDDSIFRQEIWPLLRFMDDSQLNDAEVNHSESESVISNAEEDRGGRVRVMRINGVGNLEELNSLQDVLRMIARSHNVEYEMIRLDNHEESESSEDEFRQNEEDN